MTKLVKIALFLISLIVVNCVEGCQPCYNENEQANCEPDANQIPSYTMHMSVHPHLDAFWIFDFQSYYNPQPGEGNVRSYFAIKQIFDTTLSVLTHSKKVRQTEGPSTQKAHRSFFNSQMGFFKRWYSEQTPQKKQEVKNLLKTKYWEIVGGGYVQHDEGCAYYDDIIENFQTGLHFLKDQFGYYPRAAISADSFGHSQSTLAILAHLGVQGFFVERSDEHILLQNKTEFIWKAKSANGQYYGALPTHIRWAIHGFEDQFIGGGNPGQPMCQTKQGYISNMNRENQFLKRILKSNHIMRYFGHDFQQFDDYSYSVMEGFMEKFSMQKCKKLTAVYGNPTQYFTILMGEVFNKVKPLAIRQEDIMPIWDYDSGLYWTGYYTTDPFHKKNYRDAGRYLYAARKAFTSSYISDPNSADHKQSYKILEQFAQTVSYLQHHDGVSGTSKYQVMDKYQLLVNKQVEKIQKSVFQQVFEIEFPSNINNPIFNCSLDYECEMTKNIENDVYLKVFKTGDTSHNQPIIVHLQEDQYFEADCQYQINCFCTGFPCACDLYLYPTLNTYSIIKLKKVQKFSKDPYLLKIISPGDEKDFKYNSTHIIITKNSHQYGIGYKRLNGDATPRTYSHLSRYGDQMQRGFSIRSGKYALGSNEKTEANLSKIKRVYKLQNDMMCRYVIVWARDHMKTVITIPKHKDNQWKIETISSAETGKLEDLYLQISAPHIENDKKFYTDSNGWLVMKRQLYKHEDYQAYFGPEGFDNINGNSYPMTAFAYIEDSQGNNKLSVNTDRAQGVIAFKKGTLWVNFDRLSSDDGKWVYQNTYRSEYQKFTHFITVDNKDNNERTIQKMYDEPLIIQGNSVNPSQRVSVQDYKPTKTRTQWETKTGINRVKFQVRPWNDSTLLLRVFNVKDNQNATIQLFSADNVCTFLTSYYGNQIKFSNVYETNLGGNIKYEQFIAKKWNWNQVINLSKQNQIFNKQFGQTINLRPLEIRTFVFQNIKIQTEQCKSLNQLRYNQVKQQHNLDLSKPMHVRTQAEKSNEVAATNYLLNQNHCIKKSPVVSFSQKSSANQETVKDQTHSIDTNRQTPWQPTGQTATSQNIKPQWKPVPSQPRINPKITEQTTPRPTQNPIAPTPTPSPPSPLPTPSSVQSTIGIAEKVKNNKALTKQQKQIYFSNVLENIKKTQQKKAH